MIKKDITKPEQMRLLLIALLTTLCCMTADAQNSFDIKCRIKESLTRFFEYLSSVNDDEDAVSPHYLAQEFKGSHYFILNGQETDFEDFIRSYSKRTLGKKYVNHTIVISNDNINKTSTNTADHRYTVRGRLKRSSATDEDYLVKDEAITAIVQFNGFEKEVSILELNLSTTLHISVPTLTLDNELSIDRAHSILTVPYYGGNWRINLHSRSRTIKSYPGMAVTSYGQWFPVSYDASAKIKFQNDEKAQTVSGRLGPNRSRRATRHYVKLAQNSGKTLSIYIEQAGRPRKLFEYDEKNYEQFDLFYNLKYNFGVSYMHSFEDSRLALGVLASLNYDAFRGWDKDGSTETTTSGRQTPELELYKSGYDMTKTTITPNGTNYSELLDPKDEAKHYTSRILLLGQLGLNLSQWLRFDIGIGAASAQNLHWMEEAYSLDIYHYERTRKNLPELDDMLVYHKMYNDYYFRDKIQWGFAIRPALVFHIPLDRDFDSSISLGTGYTFVTKLEKASAFDFSVGIRWEY